MSIQNGRNHNWRVAPWLIILISIPVIWSLGLLVKGLWTWTHHSDQQIIQSKISRHRNFAAVRDVPAGLFSYGGDTAWAPLRRLVDSAISSERPEFQLRYVEPIGGPAGTDKGIQMLLNDQLTFIQSSRPLLQAEYDLAKQRGFMLEQIPIAIDAIAVVVHPDLNISGLTLEQLKLIYSGQIMNWQQIKGPNLSITPFSRSNAMSDTVNFFTQEVMEGQNFGDTVQVVSTTTQALRTLANTPGAIYFDSAPVIIPQCSSKPLPLSQEGGTMVFPYRAPYISPTQCPGQRNQLNIDSFQKGQYPLTRYLYIVVKRNGRIEEKAGKTYMDFLFTEQGQTLVKRAGFVSLLR